MIINTKSRMKGDFYSLSRP